MINKIFSFLVPIAVYCFLAASAEAQGVETERGLRVNGIVIYFSLFPKGLTASEGVTRIFNIDGNTIERILINESTGMYVGYALQVERLENSTYLKLSVKPLPQEAIERMHNSVWFKKLARRHPEKRNDGPTRLPRYPEPRIIDVADAVELGLWMNPETGAQIGDRLQFELDRPLSPRDFTLDEVSLRLKNYRLFINGELRSGNNSIPGGFTAPLPWFSIPGKGRFILSIQPHEGYDFQKIGVIDDNRISFTFEGNKYEWNSTEPIINLLGKWYLWVLYDQNFEPSKDASSIREENCCVYGGFSSVNQISAKK